MRAAEERLQRDTAPAAAERRRKWGRALKARKKKVNVRLDENVPADRESTAREAAAADYG